MSLLSKRNFVILTLYASSVLVALVSADRPLVCEFYTRDDCDNATDRDEACYSGTVCDPAPGRGANCMASWTNVSGVVTLARKGCWGEDARCDGRVGCYEDLTDPLQYFCCCHGDRCNREISYRPSKPHTAEDQTRHQSMSCEYYDRTSCEQGKEDKCRQKVQRCNSTDSGKQVHCYSFMQNISGEIVMSHKGCWLHHNDCLRESCILHENMDKPFCCCSGSMCNVDMLWRPPPPPEEDTALLPGEQSAQSLMMSQLTMTLIYSLVPIVGLAVLISVSFWVWRRHRIPPPLRHEQLPTVDPSPLSPPTPDPALRSIQLLEIKARGRFGCVWKAALGNGVVAVKIFPLQDRQSFQAEKEIYQLPHFSSHDSILTYIGSERRGEHLSMELWLISEFHERGSLYDYLKGNIISWHETLRITESITKGLAFLHDAIPSSNLLHFKPPVVHRDFKSKNVLIKTDLSACIADFGLAMKFDPGRHIGDTHGQVGTRRYMAPEVLEGSINFSSDHFIRIDMYAFSLVMWEIVSRCSAADGPVAEYQLPFEEEVGLHPTLEDMQDCVVARKKRPPIPKHWLKHPGLLFLVQSIQECWDSDPEARLYAGCVEERIYQLIAATNAGTMATTINAAPLTLIANGNHCPSLQQQGPPVKEDSTASLSLV